MAYRLFENAETICQQYSAKPVVVFASGTFGNREALIMMCGPRLDLASLQKLREQILETLDVKQKQLEGKSGPDTVVVHF